MDGNGTGIAPFQRPFADGDSQLFERLIEGLRQQPCVRVAKLYGDATSIHLGRLVPNQGRGARDRGEWVVTAWGCDVVGSGPSGDFDSRVDPGDVVFRHVAAATDQELAEVALDPGDLSLHLGFSGGIRLRLLPDPDYDGDMWTISLPTRRTIAAKSGGTWVLEVVGAGPKG